MLLLCVSLYLLELLLVFERWIVTLRQPHQKTCGMELMLALLIRGVELGQLPKPDMFAFCMGSVTKMNE